MNKYNIKIIVPMFNKSYEVFVPNNILVGNFLYMLINSLNDMQEVNLNNMLLYDSFTGDELELESYVFDVLNNGSVLILV